MITTKQNNPNRFLSPGRLVSLFLLLSLIVKPLWGQDFKLTPSELKAFEGYYQFEKNQDWYLNLVVTDDGLVAKQVWDGKEYHIQPKSALEFFSAKGQYPVKFTKDGKGKITGLLAFNRDKWKKVAKYAPRQVIALSPEKLKTYEGKYTFQFQPGQDAFIQIAATANQITLTEAWSGNVIKFSPLNELEFINDKRDFPLKFVKDNSGTVTKVLAFNRDLWTKVM
jgi:uncharacterized protein YjhX (UPF0386 family)